MIDTLLLKLTVLLIIDLIITQKFVASLNFIVL